MQRMCRRIFAAVVGLFAVAGTAAAQSPPPDYLPPLPTVVPAPAAYAAIPVTPVSGATVVRGQGGCASCGTSAPTGGSVSPYPQYGLYGPKDRNGCGGARSDLGFIFGSCKSFFDPCGPQPCNGGGLCGGKGGKGGGLFNRNCAPHIPAAPYGTVYNGCVYDTYLNH